ncbi:DUF1223 domain-containing protein [Thalassorhabdomicrobium marinisediminis]|uniref:DUF1223 domain-containing protein n=1 Tax=Thalassorhabdomicrobium marinisediminis TaxID=2170577 RepID=UPI00248FC343|nr:DUF1223 domain-containing protein [Thalassorhabdomicrobium marinisediminis]
MRQFLASLLTLAAFATPVVAEGPVVVELYTSQGCSSCPPADEMLLELADRPDVLALALHVDYWDYIGWADAFADPAFTRRQQAYAKVAGSRSIYTPQMVIGGQDHVIGSKPMDVMELIEAHRDHKSEVQIALHRDEGGLVITGAAAAPFEASAIVQVVRFVPQRTVDIQHGENAGKSIVYANIVTEWRRVGHWSGARDLHLTVPGPDDGPVAVIVQERGPGAVLAAARLP